MNSGVKQPDGRNSFSVTIISCVRLILTAQVKIKDCYQCDKCLLIITTRRNTYIFNDYVIIIIIDNMI